MTSQQLATGALLVKIDLMLNCVLIDRIFLLQRYLHGNTEEKAILQVVVCVYAQLK